MNKKAVDRITLAVLIITTLIILLFLTFNISAQEIEIRQIDKILNVKADCRKMIGKDLVLKVYINSIIVCAINRFITPERKTIESGREYDFKGKVQVFLFDKETDMIITRKESIYK